MGVTSDAAGEHDDPGGVWPRPLDRILTAIEWFAAAAITLLAFFLHLVFLRHAGPLWRDEVSSIDLANLPGFNALWEMLSHDSFPLLWSLLLRGWETSQPCYRCFVGDAFDNDNCDNCAELGVLGALTGAVGHLAALIALRSLVKIGDDAAGKLFVLDATALSWRSIALPKDGKCRTCGGINAATA